MAHSPGEARALESPGTAASREWMARLFDAAEASAKPPSNTKPPARRDGPERSWFNPEAHTEAKRSWLRGRAREAVTPSRRRERNDETIAQGVSDEDAFGFTTPDSRRELLNTRSGYVDDFGDATPTGEFVFSPVAREETMTRETNDETFAEGPEDIDPPFERFFVVGVPPDARVTATAESSSAARAANAAGSQVEARRPQKKKPHRGNSGVTHPARVLFAYPPRDADAKAAANRGEKPKRNLRPRADLGDVESFCFPSGVATKLVERTPSMSAVLNVTCGSSRTPGNPGGGVEADDRSFVFSVGGGDDESPGERLFPTGDAADGDGDAADGGGSSRVSRTPRVLYGVCVYAEELVRREPGVCRAARLARRRAFRNRDSPARPSGTTEEGDAKRRAEEDAEKKNASATRERYLVSADRCYCFLSYRPAFEWHFEVLRAVAAAERFARAREAAQEISALADDARTEGGDASDSEDASEKKEKKTETLKDAMCALSESFAVVAAYESFDVSPTLQRLGGAAGVSSEAVARFRTLRCFADADAAAPAATPPMTFPGAFFPADAFSVFEHSADRWCTATACRVLSLETLLTAVTAALLERRVVVAHPNLGRLSAVVFALTRALFKPSTYSSLVLPIVPDAMLDLLEAPVPFVVGVRYKTPETRAACAAPGTVRVSAYKDAVKVSGAGAAARTESVPASAKASDLALPALPGRRALLEALRPSYDACRSAALEAERAGAPFPYPLSVSPRAPDDDADDVEEDESRSDATGDGRKLSARSAAREARRAAGTFLETWREYLCALVSKEALAPHAITDVTVAGDRVTVLMKDSFVESFRVADRAFAEALVDTQAFQAHADKELRF